MTTVKAHIDASPSSLSCAKAGTTATGWSVRPTYGRWKGIGRQWAPVGARLFHASGIWAIVTRDETAVEDVDPPRLLVLTAKGRPLGKARVTIELLAMHGGTDVTRGARFRSRQVGA